jgi:hypothetical protein
MHCIERERERERERQDHLGENTKQGCLNTIHFQDGSSNTHIRDPIIRRTDQAHKKELIQFVRDPFSFHFCSKLYKCKK